ncbi:3D-(3,5/4)-trihydroxycyclohexane-1,2-dione acylhydrolase (decyclizing) [Candidatus Pantoea symbiotica]|uniref:3D-(3,5/4)-trihydroxycyclohexane-1,2-dione acylhydrolase (Decyclizing) n=1 Tax=Candidatus Pantoea symbiotica TaxID=1884370 RepID=A0A1I4E1K2_9GAMM|nr:MULTISPECIES: 3D-(3,5/4)-trihydroxycyclohexane-1,2-dione acylhydrolase (decyclizing) [Pantoea]KAJ9431473.1 3D-(3,5/4)-trihydroxycyclohexane-1,2-dione acylhydrolase (decyclizing) [Pantoea sp. YR343]MRS21036.1 3D-(3,5/4)-trihydroxycyclohexane-1,2-dione acylhydrolase (decyclizing) [Enterobacteriaceae bacterium RIT692]SFK98031.1 3D-(3,5/4)-trihydroxycyclohexane-1,2-dione acylhydrolase (decyclizing) [Pantoea symbiotica]SFV06843.1 3D-(3,5/4)-trihydroxycyclohexane-1,2-dione acylhydrolase (decyclizi
MGTIRLTTAQALVKFLDNQYLNVDGVETKFVKGIFAIFGHGNVLGLGQALEQDSGDLVVHQGRNEQGMAHAAIGFAKQSLRRQIIACTSSVGPGAANMITAAATATANRIPLLLLPGDVFATRQPDPVLQQIEQSHDLSISTNDAFRAVSKYWDRVSRPEQLMTACINALRVLTDPAETGAVTIALPQDVQGEAWDFPEYFFQKRVHRLDRRLPTAAQLQDALALIARKHKPLIIVGGGLKYSDAGDALLKFAERFNIPFAETQAGKGTIVSDHPLNVGGVGETGCLAANLLAKEADLVIGIGTRYTDFTTASKWIFQNPDVSYLNLNVSNFDSYKLDAVQLLADAREGLTALESGLQGFENHWGGQIELSQSKLLKETQRVYAATYNTDDFIPEIADHADREALFAEFERLTKSVLTQSSVLGTLNEQLPKDAVIVAAAGSLPGDLQRVWRTKDYNSYHVEYGYSCMGYEVNAALGVKLAQPQREVYVMVGDGSFMMLHSELVTSIQEGAKINVVLLDNMTNGCINNLQMEHGMDSFTTEFRFRNPEGGKLDGGFVPVDFAAIAGGYGCKTYRITTLEQLEAALIDAQKQTVSVLFDIKVLPKTMVHKYFSWWHVGVAQTSTSERTQEVADNLNVHIEQARKY